MEYPAILVNPAPSPLKHVEQTIGASTQVVPQTTGENIQVFIAAQAPLNAPTAHTIEPLLIHVSAQNSGAFTHVAAHKQFPLKLLEVEPFVAALPDRQVASPSTLDTVWL
jgi:hypothetical protein